MSDPTPVHSMLTYVCVVHQSVHHGRCSCLCWSLISCTIPATTCT